MLIKCIIATLLLLTGIYLYDVTIYKQFKDTMEELEKEDEENYHD